MLWHEITIYTTEEATEAIADWLHGEGAGGVSIEESGNLDRKRDTSLGQWYEKPLNNIPEGEAVMKAYFSEHSELEQLITGLKQFLDSLPSFGIDPGKKTVETAEIREEDWADSWKQYFKPTHVSERLVIKPTWEEYEAKPGEVIVELDPGMAFGTGTHATTALCMRTLEDVIAPGDHVIDVGTGSGILSIAAAKLGAGRILALDLDPVAVSSAQENVRLNGLSDLITVRLSDLLQAIRTQEAGAEDVGVKLPVQVVVANILAEIILTFVDDVYQALAPGGTYVASGIITSKEQDVANALLDAGFELKGRREENDWVALVAVKK
ncbi:50S ribosomal protein L11 methyltransferase [Paenibacillus thermotolerans]|uniref:50S ribosomal protein L11 methyltransferase n=1 Tax=Paenibacillus thermotolerans TaxID=3027807 RepID=UPI002368B025|nr:MULTISPECIES: 50S ribosomal protein L11 methyltransferase [unclassified Paenibacillus]